MNLNSIPFLIREAFLNIRRNGLMSLAALGTVTMALAVFGASVWSAYRLSEVARMQPQKFNSIDVFLPSTAERDTTLELQTRLSQMPLVSRVKIYPKEVAWAQFQSQEPEMTEALTENPLPDKLEVELKDAANVSELARRLRRKTDFPDIEKVIDPGEEVRTLIGFAGLIRVIGFSVALGLFAATLFIVQNTIRLTVFARRREIRVMQLVGATPGFIRMPLLLEGLFHGTVGGMIAAGVILLCGREVSKFVVSLKSPLIGDVPTLIGPAQVFFLLVAVGAFIGVTGSYLSMRRFLKQI